MGRAVAVYPAPPRLVGKRPKHPALTLTAITLRNFVGAVCNRTSPFKPDSAVTNRTYDLPRFLT